MKKSTTKVIAIVKRSNDVFGHLGGKIFLVAVVLLAFSLLCVYFYQIQRLISDSYLLSDTQKDLLKTQDQNLSFAQQNPTGACFDKIEQEILALNFVKNDNIKYIPLSNDYLVRVDQ